MASTGAVADAAASAPTVPGIYVFLDAEDVLLYVGKAGNLRSRLRQHAAAEPGGGRLDVLYRRTATVRWEEHPTELAAAAREADLIVALRPALNAAIVGQGKWVHIVVDHGAPATRLTLEREPARGHAYGVFPHLGRGVSSAPAIACSEGYASLVRLLWAGHAAQPGDRFPASIAGPSPPDAAELALPDQWRDPLHRLLSGTSDALVGELLDATSRLEAYVRPALRRDADGARAFFVHGPRALRELRLRHGRRAGPMAREEVERMLAADLRASIGDFRLAPSVDETGGLLGERASTASALRGAMRDLR